MKLLRPLTLGDKIKVKDLESLLHNSGIFHPDVIDYSDTWLTIVALDDKISYDKRYATAELSFMIYESNINILATNWWLFKQSFKRGS